MRGVHLDNLRQLGEQIDGANKSLAFTRQQQRNAEAAARQILTTARAEADEIRKRAEWEVKRPKEAP
jgi:cell division septum initiation protein DivIVA